MQPIVITDSNALSSITSLSSDQIIGITGEGVRTVLNNWNTYKNSPWISNLVIPPSGSTIQNYATTMKDQVNAIASIYDVMLEKRQDAPKFSDTFATKLSWGISTISSLNVLSTTTVLGWISAGVNSQMTSQ